MKTFLLSSLFIFLIFNISAFADEAAPPPTAAPEAETSAVTSYRSQPDKHIWISGNAGLQGGIWGVNTGGGFGGKTGVGLRAQFGRWSGVFEWNRELMQYYQPDPISEMSVLGAGVAFRVVSIGEHRRFWRGSHILARALLEYASNRYDLFDHKDNPITSGKTYGWGGLVGVDFMLPIYVGFWGFLGTGIEVLNFRYNIPENTAGIRDAGGPTDSLFLRVGLAYGF